MRFVKANQKDQSGEFLWQPAKSHDVPLFSHCSGGLIWVTTSHLKNKVQPLLVIHGVHEFSFAKE